MAAVEFPSGCVAYFTTLHEGKPATAIFRTAREYSIQGAGAFLILRDAEGAFCGGMPLRNLACLMPLETVSGTELQK